jgi:hypothetical protein
MSAARTAPPPALCQLCATPSTLQRSHVVPKFAARWLKETGATPYLRHTVNVNKRVQDFPTLRFLCAKCEAQLSADETRFANEIFYPYHQRRTAPFDYDEWLLRFVISLAWRLGATWTRGLSPGKAVVAPQVGRLSDPAKRALTDALLKWQMFLIGLDPDPGPYEHHMFFFDYVESVQGDWPDGLHRYMFRMIDADTPHGRESVAVYVKLPGIILWSGIAPAHVEGFEGTLIGRRGTIGSPQKLANSSIGHYLIERIPLVNALAAEMSPRQAATIRASYVKNPARVAGSETHRVSLADALLRQQIGRHD